MWLPTDKIFNYKVQLSFFPFLLLNVIVIMTYSEEFVSTVGMHKSPKDNIAPIQ